MNSFEKMQDFSNKFKEISKNSPFADASKNANALFKGALTKMELVTREEFDAQAAVLLKTQAKLIELEAKVAELTALSSQEK